MAIVEASTRPPPSADRSEPPARQAMATAPGSSAAARIELVGVYKTFAANGDAPVVALAGLSLRLGAGAAVLVRGPSGSGKTTLLCLIGCMTRPTAGRIRVCGRDVTRLPEDELALLRRSAVGFVFQGNHLLRGSSALVNVMLPAIPSPEVNGRLRADAELLLDRFGLRHRARARVERLSGGEQQRIAIARALINDPLIVLADEPTAHLDKDATRRFLDCVAELRDAGRTVVVASHDAALAEPGVFSQILRLSHGQLRRVM